MREALYLRYGTESPCIGRPPPPLLSVKTAARLMKISRSSFDWLMHLYFEAKELTNRESISPPKFKAKPSKNTKVTAGNILLEEVEYIIDPDNLQSWAHLSITGRCIHFHRRFNNRRIDRHTYSVVMRRAGLSRKKVLIKNIPAKRTLRISEFERRILALDEKM
jgi:hypothetical protein